MTGAPHTLLAEPGKERERGKRLEDGGPDGVEVDRRRHDRDVRLIRGELRELDVVDVDRPARILLGRRNAGEHVLLDGTDARAAAGRGQRERRHRGRVAGQHRVANGVDLVHVGGTVQHGLKVPTHG